MTQQDVGVEDPDLLPSSAPETNALSVAKDDTITATSASPMQLQDEVLESAKDSPKTSNTAASDSGKGSTEWQEAAIEPPDHGEPEVHPTGSMKLTPAEEKELEFANSTFTRKNGLIYVPDKYFVRLIEWARHCHIYISAIDGDKGLEGHDAAHVDSHPLVHPSKLQQNNQKASAKDMPSSQIPPRIKIVNSLLAEDLVRVCTSHEATFSYHLSPYRGLVTHEREIKERHQELEAQFRLLSSENPDHFAIQRSEEFLHYNNGDLIRAFETDISYDDTINQQRSLLDGYRALIQFFDTDLCSLLESCRRIRELTADTLPFSHLWYLFALHPDTPIVAGPQAYQVTNVRGGRLTVTDGEVDKDYDLYGASINKWSMNWLEIDCFSVGFDGNEFSPVLRNFLIAPYDGSRKIKDLVAYPVSFATDLSPVFDLDTGEKKVMSLSEKLSQRGQVFERLTKVGHYRYQGLSLRESGSFDTREEIDSDIVVDLELAYRTEPRISAPEFYTPEDTINEEQLHIGRDLGTCEFNLRLKMLWQDSFKLLLDNMYQAAPLEERALAILPYKVYGYVLFRRRWLPLSIDLIRKIPPAKPGEKDGFKKLVLPRGHKEIIRALVNTHVHKFTLDENASGSMDPSQQDFDLVKGKGRGLIILLHGAPGVGKTSTAECVATNARRPLFHITCGDVGGESAQEVEANLERFFDMAGKWNCVLLLDEADVFLSTRQSGNIKQNSLVSVFLRVLEYYPGILILTTNRVGNFDEAIKSRVHCALYYPPLNEERTFKIWKSNIRAMKERNEKVEEKFRVRFKASEIEDFARYHWRQCERHERWNGRQIKNAFQTAVAMAEWRMLERKGPSKNQLGPRLLRRDFEGVAEANKHFDNYLKRVRMDDEALARGAQLRDDKITDRFEEDEDESDIALRKPKKGRSKIRTVYVSRKTTRRKARVEEDEDDDDDEEDEEEDEDEGDQDDEDDEDDDEDDEEEEDEDEGDDSEEDEDEDEEDEDEEDEDEDENSVASSEDEVRLIKKAAKKGKGAAKAKAEKEKAEVSKKTKKSTASKKKSNKSKDSS